MQLWKTALTGIIVSVSLYLPQAMASESSTNVTVASQTQQAEYLFVMQADKAIITKTDTGYQLILQATDPRMLFFSDCPVRKAGTLGTSKFMSIWMAPGSSFAKDHPNAAIVFDQMRLISIHSPADSVEMGKPRSYLHHPVFTGG